MKLAWDPERYEGIGPDKQAICAIPYCGLVTDARGLCYACYMAWRRGGLEGLERRALRVMVGHKIQVPYDVDKALEMLIDTYEEWVQVDDQEIYDALKKRLVKICQMIGTSERRKKWAKYSRKWREDHGQRKGALGRGKKALDKSLDGGNQVVMTSQADRAPPMGEEPTTSRTEIEDGFREDDGAGRGGGDRAAVREAGEHRAGGVARSLPADGDQPAQRAREVREGGRRAGQGREGRQGQGREGGAREAGEEGQEVAQIAARIDPLRLGASLDAVPSDLVLVTQEK